MDFEIPLVTADNYIIQKVRIPATNSSQLVDLTASPPTWFTSSINQHIRVTDVSFGGTVVQTLISKGSFFINITGITFDTPVNMTGTTQNNFIAQFYFYMDSTGVMRAQLANQQDISFSWIGGTYQFTVQILDSTGNILTPLAQDLYISLYVWDATAAINAKQLNLPIPIATGDSFNVQIVRVPALSTTQSVNLTTSPPAWFGTSVNKHIKITDIIYGGTVVQSLISQGSLFIKLTGLTLNSPAYMTGSGQNSVVAQFFFDMDSTGVMRATMNNSHDVAFDWIGGAYTFGVQILDSTGANPISFKNDLFISMYIWDATTAINIEVEQGTGGGGSGIAQGGPLTQALNGGFQQINSLASGGTVSSTNYNAATIADVFNATSGKYLPLIGGTMSGAIDLGTEQINHLASAGGISTNAANFGDVTAALGNYLPLAGGIMTGNITMSNHQIGSLASGGTLSNTNVNAANISDIYNATNNKQNLVLPVTTNDVATFNAAGQVIDSGVNLTNNSMSFPAGATFNLGTGNSNIYGDGNMEIESVYNNVWIQAAPGKAVQIVQTPLDMNHNQIQNVQSGGALSIGNTNGASISDIYNAVTSYLPLAGGTMTGPIDMNTQNINSSTGALIINPTGDLTLTPSTLNINAQNCNLNNLSTIGTNGMNLNIETAGGSININGDNGVVINAVASGVVQLGGNAATTSVQCQNELDMNQYGSLGDGSIINVGTIATGASNNINLTSGNITFPNSSLHGVNILQGNSLLSLVGTSTPGIALMSQTDMNNNGIINLASGGTLSSTNTNAANIADVYNATASSGVYLPTAGGTMTGPINMSTHQITALASGGTLSNTNANAANITDVYDATNGVYLPLAGGQMTGAIDMNGKNLESTTGALSITSTGGDISILPSTGNIILGNTTYTNLNASNVFTINSGQTFVSSAGPTTVKSDFNNVYIQPATGAYIGCNNSQIQSVASGGTLSSTNTNAANISDIYNSTHGIYLPLTGGTMTGGINGGGFQLTNIASGGTLSSTNAANMADVNSKIANYLPLTGGTVTGTGIQMHNATIDMGNYQITGLASGMGLYSNAANIADVGQQGALFFLSKNGDTMTGPINMSTHQITALASGGTLSNTNTNAANMTDVYNATNGVYLPLAGGTMTGGLNMNTQNVTNLGVLSGTTVGLAASASMTVASAGPLNLTSAAGVNFSSGQNINVNSSQLNNIASIDGMITWNPSRLTNWNIQITDGYTHFLTPGNYSVGALTLSTAYSNVVLSALQYSVTVGTGVSDSITFNTSLTQMHFVGITFNCTMNVICNTAGSVTFKNCTFLQPSNLGTGSYQSNQIFYYDCQWVSAATINVNELLSLASFTNCYFGGAALNNNLNSGGVVASINSVGQASNFANGPGWEIMGVNSNSGGNVYLYTKLDQVLDSNNPNNIPPAPCDIRLKDNIEQFEFYKENAEDEEIDDFQSNLLAVKPYNFTYKSDTAKRQKLGFMAQDLRRAFPKLKDILWFENESGFMSVDETKLIPILWKRVSDLEVTMENILDKRSTSSRESYLGTDEGYSDYEEDEPLSNSYRHKLIKKNKLV